MKTIPPALLSPFKVLLASKNIPEGYHANYLKWLRYYLDFCHKYGYSESNPQSLPDFIGKLIDKNQTAAQQKQADLAIRFYYELSQAEHKEFREKSTQKQQLPKLVKENEKIFGAPSPKKKMQPGQSKPDSTSKTDSHKIRNEKWNAALNDLANEIKVRHYSPKTTMIYTHTVKSTTIKEAKSPLDF